MLDVWRYYAVEASDEIANKVIQQIVAAAKRASEMPLTGRSRDELLPGIRSVLAQPYVVFYRINENEVQIVRVIHERRNLAAELAKRD